MSNETVVYAYSHFAAVNAIGESQPLETKRSIIAKNEFDEPSAPGKPDIKNWDKDFVELEWSKVKYKKI
jgi:hypothetical protein